MAVARTVTTEILTDAQRQELSRLLDAIPRPLPELCLMDAIAEPHMLAALDYFGEVWRRIWRAWQYAGGPHPPALPCAYQCYGGSWLAMRDADRIVGELRALAAGEAR